MSTLKECTVVMLPTKDKSNIVKANTSTLLWYDERPIVSKHHTHQHLYILSSDKIKEGDWMVTNAGHVFKCTDNSMRDRQDLAKKIIATTDKSIAYEESLYDPRSKTGGGMIPLLPEPSQSFIKKYCEKGGIDKVMVEYDWEWAEGSTLKHGVKDYKPKVSADNTITISRVKDSWSRDEVEELLNKLKDATVESDFVDVDEFIKENL